MMVLRFGQLFYCLLLNDTIRSRPADTIG
ncbi:uncharacterized protein METZ01_LOCUS483649, partial [marine metagenome]